MNETKYTCAICGKSYTDLSERIDCETKCYADRKAAEEKKRKMEMKRKQAESEKAVLDMLLYTEEIVRQHIEEYGAITINEEHPYLSYIFGSSKFWF